MQAASTETRLSRQRTGSSQYPLRKQPDQVGGFTRNEATSDLQQQIATACGADVVQINVGTVAIRLSLIGRGRLQAR